MINTIPTDNAAPPMPQDDALLEALRRLLTPLVHLCLAKGVTFAATEELLKQTFVREADTLQPGAPDHGKVSRISTVTGINRREVTRLTKSGSSAKPAKHPLAAEVFARWTTDPMFKDHNGAPCVLKRQGEAPSFDALAQSITRDVHPRSMLDELVRLGIAQHDEKTDSVSLLRSDFVPGTSSPQMLAFLGENVGDHLDAAVANVMHGGGRHLEQAVFADELSTESISKLLPLVASQWKVLRDAMVPAITELIEADKMAGREQDQRMRIGMYSFTEAMQADSLINDDPSELPGSIITGKDNTYES